jgi:RNA polymerase sigma-70 factor, ECF subfamily
MQTALASESTWVRSAQRGDAAAWRALLGEYGPTVYSLCRRLDPDPNDAYQVIWEKVVNALHRFDPAGPSPLLSWLMTIAHRTLVDRHRRRTVREVVVPFADPPEAIAPTEDPVAVMDRAQLREELDEAMHRLPEAQRRVVVLHHVHGVDLPAIAATEGVAIGTLKSRLHRGRARLQTLLASHLRTP